MMSRTYLLYSYVVTVLLFAWIYTATYTIHPKSWRSVACDGDESSVTVMTLYTRYLFFSVSTATLCGSSRMLPKKWYTCLLVAIQRLLSFVYFTSVLAITLRLREQREELEEVFKDLVDNKIEQEAPINDHEIELLSEYQEKEGGGDGNNDDQWSSFDF